MRGGVASVPPGAIRGRHFPRDPVGSGLDLRPNVVRQRDIGSTTEYVIQLFEPVRGGYVQPAIPSEAAGRPAVQAILIVFSKLTKAYGDRVAVQDLTFRVAPGEIYVLLGANGAGKTTALRCLATLLTPTSGTAVIAGHDVRTQPLLARSKLGFLSASMGLYERLSARELLEYFAQLQGMSEEATKARVDELIEIFDITSFKDRYCGRLSTGQRQRVSIARAVIHDPPAIVMDEPTFGLDVLSGRTIYAFMHTARMRKCAVLFSTHQIDEVELLADRVGVLYGGRLLVEGTVEELLEQTGQRSLARAFLQLVEEQ
jgi:sodium transport system ATP-binding protein